MNCTAELRFAGRAMYWMAEEVEVLSSVLLLVVIMSFIVLVVQIYILYKMRAYNNPYHSKEER